MYLSTITLKNFRKYAYDGVSKHGITVNFHKGLNALIGENDSGKSAIIDAIKLVLQTQSGEFTRVTDEDFYISATGELQQNSVSIALLKDLKSMKQKILLNGSRLKKIKPLVRCFINYSSTTGHGVKMVVFILNSKLEISKTVYRSMAKRENS